MILEYDKREAARYDSYKEEYIEGWNAFFAGLKEQDNPYELSNHERETLPQDERNYAWDCGWGDAWEAANEAKS